MWPVVVTCFAPLVSVLGTVFSEEFLYGVVRLFYRKLSDHSSMIMI
jgi:hypothetical protein